jgi:uncharacterized membrane protein YfcA
LNFDPTTLHVIAVVFLATLIRSSFGFGEALVAVPLLALRIPIAQAAPLAVACSVLVAAIIIVQDHEHIHIRSAAGLLAASLVGIPLGLWLLKAADPRAVKIALAAVIISFSCYALFTKRLPELTGDHPLWLAVCGFIAGILGGVFGMNGPALVVYGSLRRWSAKHFRATLQAYFLPASLLGLIGYWLSGLWVSAVTHDFLIALPGIIVAVFLGRWINRRLRGQGYVRYLYAFLIAVGLTLLFQSFHR